MEWLDSLFKEQSAFQAVVVISAIAAVGLVFSKVKWRGIGFGVAFVFFAGILAGHLGLSVDQPKVSAWGFLYMFAACR